MHIVKKLINIFFRSFIDGLIKEVWDLNFQAEYMLYQYNCYTKRYINSEKNK